MKRPALAAIASLALCQILPADQPRGTLLEAERYSEKVTEDAAFCRILRDHAASGRKALVRFYKPGYLLFRFQVPRAGLYHGWLRYSTRNNNRIGLALDPDGQPKFTVAPLASTGSLEGPGAWGWARLFSTNLTAGQHVLALNHAAIRPDCIFLTPEDQKPTDTLLESNPMAHLDSRTKKLLAKPLAPVSPDWLKGAEEYRLPLWFEQYRVHAHTRLSLNYASKDVFIHAARLFKQMGVHTFARHIKSGREGAWWPSEVGLVNDLAKDRNLAKEIIDEAHREGMRILVYHRHMEDEGMAKLHPDWVCKDWKGRPLSSRRGKYMCFNSPYPDYFLNRALELEALGADGFYFDHVHMPKTGCWCQYCRKKFKEETGLDHPRDDDPFNPVWHKLKDFNNLTIERTFVKWRKAIHAANPDLVMLVGSNTWPTLSDRQMTNRLFRIADVQKTEFSLPARNPPSLLFPVPKDGKPVERDAKIALGYTLARDATGGRPPHVWAHGLLDEAATLYAAAGIMTHGCIANLDIPEKSIPNRMFKKAFELGDRVSPHFAGTRPLRWAAIHFSERARDKYILDPAQAWKKVLYPTYGAFLALLRAHLPVGLITDSQLEDGLLKGYEVLFLPAPDPLTRRMLAAVSKFEARGGLVIRQSSQWHWYDARGGQEQAIQEFMRRLQAKVTGAPVQVFGGPEKMHSDVFRKPGAADLTISLANDFSWVYTGRKPPKDKLPELTRTPPPCTGVEILLRTAREPKRVLDAVSGKNLTAKKTPDGYRIQVPDFHTMAVIVVQ